MVADYRGVVQLWVWKKMLQIYFYNNSLDDLFITSAMRTDNQVQVG